MVQHLTEEEKNEQARRVHWTTNCVIFGAELFKKLSMGLIKKEEAIAQIKNLTSELNDEQAAYLLRRLNDLVYSR